MFFGHVFWLLVGRAHIWLGDLLPLQMVENCCTLRQQVLILLSHTLLTEDANCVIQFLRQGQWETPAQGWFKKRYGFSSAVAFKCTRLGGLTSTPQCSQLVLKHLTCEDVQVSLVYLVSRQFSLIFHSQPWPRTLGPVTLSVTGCCLFDGASTFICAFASCHGCIIKLKC